MHFYRQSLKSKVYIHKLKYIRAENNVINCLIFKQILDKVLEWWEEGPYRLKAVLCVLLYPEFPCSPPHSRSFTCFDWIFSNRWLPCLRPCWKPQQHNILNQSWPVASRPHKSMTTHWLYLADTYKVRVWDTMRQEHTHREKLMILPFLISGRYYGKCCYH